MKFLFLIISLLTISQGTVFKDLYNRDVNILDKQNNKKIVCLGPGSLRLVTYLNLQNSLVGVEKRELDFNPNSPYTLALDKEFIKSLPIIGQGGPGKMPNLESLITIKPDVIFATFMSKEQIELIQNKTNIPVIALSYGQTIKDDKKIELIKKSLKLIASITKSEKRLNELLTFMNQEEEKISNFNVSSKRVYVGGTAFKGIQGVTSTESDYPSFELLNMKNEILQNHHGHAFINLETLLAFNPEIIFFDSLSKKIINEEISKNKAIFENIDAFKTKEIHWLNPSNFYNINVENIYLNSYLIASKFETNIDVNSAKKRIYTLFLGIGD